MTGRPDVEYVIPQVWFDALLYAVRRNKGILKVSTYRNHIAPAYGHPFMDNGRIHALYAAMERDGYVVRLEKHGRGGVHVWRVTDKGREAVA